MEGKRHDRTVKNFSDKVRKYKRQKFNESQFEVNFMDNNNILFLITRPGTLRNTADFISALGIASNVKKSDLISPENCLWLRRSFLESCKIMKTSMGEILQGLTKVKIAEGAQFQLWQKIAKKNCRRKFGNLEPLKR